MHENKADTAKNSQKIITRPFTIVTTMSAGDVRVKLENQTDTIAPFPTVISSMSKMATKKLRSPKKREVTDNAPIFLRK